MFKSFFSSFFTNKYQKCSFSQTGEDLIIRFIFDCLNIKKPNYLDIGAYHPFQFSNTAFFYQNGSRGINIEPDKSLFKKFEKYRKEDVNLNLAVWQEKTEIDFFIMNHPALNTLHLDIAQSYQKEGNYYVRQTQKVPTITLNQIIEKYSEGKFPQFLNIDVEGSEDIILQQIDYKTNFPLVICAETITFSTNGQGIKNQTLINFLLQNNYIQFADTYINTIFVRNEYWKK